MRAIILTPGDTLPRNAEELFDDVIYIKASERSEVKDVERRMEKRGIKPFDTNEFVLYYPALEDIGLSVSRNRFNSGMIVGHRYANLMLGDTPVYLRRCMKLPYEGDSRVMIVAPHFEEDFGMIMTKLHKDAGDSLYLLFVTDINEEIGTVEKSHEIYQDILGLEEGREYGFLGLKTNTVHTNTEKLRKGLKKAFDEFKPNTVIIPSVGGNRDHITVHDTCREVIQTGVNIIFGHSVQSDDFIPRIFHLFDPHEARGLVSEVYSSGDFGPKEYVYTVGELFKTRYEPVSRYLAGKDIEVSCYGTMPLYMNHEYRIPHKTSLEI